MQELHASISVQLSEDPREAARMLAKISALWSEMLTKLDEAATEVEASLTINEARRQTKRERTRRLTAADFKAQSELKELKQVS